MNETIKKAIALAKDLNGEYVHLTDAIKRLIDAVLACEESEPTKWVPKPGEEVEVFRKGTTEDYVLSGHVKSATWEDKMDSCVGRVYIVSRIKDTGIKLECTFIFPLNCLRPVAKEPEKWMPKAGEWATHSIQGYTSRIVRTAVENGHLFVWLERDDKLGIQSQILRQPTPEEIAIAERRERLPPIPPGMVWVVDRSEPPHPEAKFLAISDTWEFRLHPHLSYRLDYEYIKPAEPLADTVSIPATKAEPLMFTIYAM